MVLAQPEFKMITIIYSTHKDSKFNDSFKKHLLESIGIKSNYVQILEYQNNNQYTLSEIYNRGISESINNIIVCCHNDIKLEKNWGKKLLKDFENNPNYAIIGKAGSCYFPESGIYWEKLNQTMVGQVWHHPEGKNKWLSRYSSKFEFLIPVVTIDGLFISFDKTKIIHKFDETIGKFHFYDHCFCIPNFLDGVKIGVTSSFEITHQSVGQPSEEFYITKDKFVEKYKTKLPLDLKPTEIFLPTLKDKKIKNTGKVAVIILSKNKLDLLFQCIDSFYKHCDSNYFDIFVADTGSSDEELKEMNLFFKDKNIKLLEYNFYNFSKINNHIVTNHISDKYEFLLFCNNDIKLLNNVIQEMLFVFKNYGSVGTVGARLHYSDNTIQHDGIFGMLRQKEKAIHVGHQNPNSYYNFKTEIVEIVANTAALLMVNKKIFKKFGMFDESYKHCFEDVQFNLNCIIGGYKNYINGKCVAIHFESQTRDLKSTESEFISDYNNILIPFIKRNFEKIKKYFYIV